jgi:hypothetical protein
MFSAGFSASVINSTNLSVSKVAAIFNDENLSVSKAAMIINHENFSISKAVAIISHENLSVSKAATIINHENLSVSKAYNIITHGDLSADRTQEILYNIPFGTKLVDILTYGAGNLTVSSNTTISGVNRYNTLTVNSGITLTINGQPGALIVKT